jgi:cation diffusion facilitator CzcD-associated flavoprotein CzcO
MDEALERLRLTVANEGAAHFDAVVIGAGFSGLYALKKLRDELKLNVLVVEKGADVGGAWYWNRYPGALSDSETSVYCFSDKEIFQDWEWNTRYVTQPQILSYLQFYADRCDLRRNIQFETLVQSAHYDDDQDLWKLTTSTGQTLMARYLITAIGPLSATHMPHFPGQERFNGELFHTAAWPAHADVTGKRVGVIGTGSTGIQLSTAIVDQVRHLTVFQRTPQYTIPVGNGPVPDEFVTGIKRNAEVHWNGVFGSYAGMGINESKVPAMSVSAEERRATFQKFWDLGGGFRFALESFCDILVDPKANEAAADFIREKIAEIVKDPKTAAKLMPYGPYNKRPLCDSGYYQMFNRDNVSLVDVRETPIEEVTEEGVRTADGIEHELDVLVFATGFDALDGNFKRFDLRGRQGVFIGDHWKDGSMSYLGLSTSRFPNMFMIQGPNGVFSNAPPAIELAVSAIARLISLAEKEDLASLEVKPESEREWIDTCVKLADGTLLGLADTWFFGANIPGKPRRVLFYVGGVAGYRQTLADVDAGGYPGFERRARTETAARSVP